MLLNIFTRISSFSYHQGICIAEVFFEFFNGFALGHDFRLLFKLTEPNLLAFPVEHGK
jgi:hypothetical protein